MRRSVRVVLALAVAAVLVACGQGGGTGGLTGGSRKAADDTGVPPVLIGLVTKSDTNPYFIRIRQAAIDAVRKWPGARLEARSGAYDGDNEGQVAAVRELVAMEASAILITPSNSTGIVEALTQARQAGVLVIALDTETSPRDAVDATFATDNVAAGTSAGAALRAALPDRAAQVVVLNGTPGSAVSDQRRQGFLAGFGAEGAAVVERDTGADPVKARAAMTELLAAHPDVAGVYAINEPVAEAARDALVAAGAADRVRVTTIDGSCRGVIAVESGQFVADVMQFPTAMASKAVDAAMLEATAGTAPPPGVTDTGAEVITTDAVSGVPSRGVDWGLRNCWG